MINETMKRIVAEQKLGFVATASVDGTPNLSPKGTFLVKDDEHLMFGEMRSPNTLRNLEANPKLEINFVDVFERARLPLQGRGSVRRQGHRRVR